MTGPTIHTIDLEYLGTPEAIASYVIEGPAGPVMIETGPGRTTDTLTSGLAKIGLTPADVKHVLVTHIHFDHAGATGWMASHGAQIHVHEYGAAHLVDPTRLVASARRIYGDEMDRRWGTLVPIPERQVTAVHDGDAIDVGGLVIRAIETPGHARHHHAFVLETGDGRVCFTGDVGATFVAECPSFISLPTPPPEFDLEAWIASIDRLRRERFDRLYPTHFGVVDDPESHLSRIVVALREHAQFVRAMMLDDLPEETILDRYTAWFAAAAAEAGLPAEKMGFYVTDTLARMNVGGLRRYWKKQMERHQATAAG